MADLIEEIYTQAPDEQPAYVLGDISIGDFLDRKMDSYLEKGRQSIYREIFTLEGKILHKEYPSKQKLFTGILGLFDLYKLVDDGPPYYVADALEKEICEAKKELASHNKHLELIENGFISHRLVIKMRLESGLSDFEVLNMIHKCQKEGKTFENPGGKAKYFDPRLRKLY